MSSKIDEFIPDLKDYKELTVSNIEDLLQKHFYELGYDPERMKFEINVKSQLKITPVTNYGKEVFEELGIQYSDCEEIYS